MLCQPLWWLVISLFLIVFFFWCCFPKSLLLTFHSRVSLKSWPPISFPSRLLNLTFLDSAFWLSLFLSFFPGEPNPFLLGWRFSQLLSFIVLSRLLEVPAPCSWIITFQAFWSLSASLGDWKGRIYSSFLVFLGALFELSQSHPSCAARPKNPEPLAASRYPSPILPTRLPLISWSWQARFFPFFPSFHGP